MPRTLPSCDGRVPDERSQAAELLAELDDDVVEEDFDSDEADEDAGDDFESDDELGFEAGLLLDEEPRESLR